MIREIKCRHKATPSTDRGEGSTIDISRQVHFWSSRATLLFMKGAEMGAGKVGAGLSGRVERGESERYCKVGWEEVEGWARGSGDELRQGRAGQGREEAEGQRELRAWDLGRVEPGGKKRGGRGAPCHTTCHRKLPSTPTYKLHLASFPSTTHILIL